MAAHKDVSVSWRLKALAFNAFDRMPFGEQVYYFFQKNITKTYPRKLSPTAESARSKIKHAEFMVERFADVASINVLEIGAGWDLYSNFIYYCFGIENQTAVDVRRWARAETINAVIQHLQIDPPVGAVRVPEVLVDPDNLDSSLLDRYGIRYLAPADARNLDFEAHSIDVVATSSVLEHIPTDIILPILQECRRVLKPDGVMRHTVDYSDHYAHADSAITDFNMLRFSDSEWAYYNPGIHYQNRLRTPDYLKLFQKAGFECEKIEEWSGIPREFENTDIHPRFDNYTKDQLMTLGSLFTLSCALGVESAADTIAAVSSSE